MRYPILNIWTDAVNMQGALDKVAEFVEKGDRLHTVFASNPEKNFSVPKDEFLYGMFKNADLLIPDGIGVVLAAKLLHGANVERVPGCELMQNICAMSAERGYKVYLYGAKEEVSKIAEERLKERFPAINIVGRSNGYVKAEEMDELVEKINESEADILFLALGSPRQERWISTYADQLKTVRVAQGIGGTLDVIAGSVKRAPVVFCKTGLEWFYRLASDPSRWKRQKVLPLFAFNVLKAKVAGMFG